MKKQLLLSILAVGLMNDHIQAVGSFNLQEAIQHRDADKFILRFEQLLANSEEKILSTIKELFASGEDLKGITLHGTDKYFGKYAMSPIDILLLYAVESSKYNVAEFLLKNGADVNIQEPFEGNTALMLATENNDDQMIRLLMNYGAELKVKNEEGNTALDYVVIN